LSTIKTISITKNTHLYKDLSIQDTLYIEIEDINECSFEIWTSEDQTSSRAVVKISKEDFEKMIDAYRSQEN
jgi:hypothetical protein|tara:strand:+ start:2511 stop:2726 length:216 start_codon:yes stop_codon:yes gene_type:complete